MARTHDEFLLKYVIICVATTLQRRVFYCNSQSLNRVLQLSLLQTLTLIKYSKQFVISRHYAH